MKPYFAVLTVLVLFSCSRQPVRVGATMPEGPAPAETLPATVKPNQADGVPANVSRVNAELERAPEDGPVVSPPRKGDYPIAPKVSVIKPATETNETANIENQGAVGSLPLTDDETAESPAELPTVTLSKSACYGNCAVYALSYLPSGVLMLNVTSGLMGPGTYRSELSTLDQRDFTLALDSLRDTEFAPLYPVEEELPADIPFTRLIVPDEEDGGRTITVYFDAPAALQRFMDRMEALVEDSNWKLMPAAQR